jgi:hypothetical protein
MTLNHVQDLIKLYAVYNDALINILEKFFEMTKPQCKEAMAAYKKFITRQEPVHKFLELAEEVGVDKQSHLNLRHVPEDLLPALESHLSEMDSIKKAPNAQPSPQIKAASEKLAKLHPSPSSSSSQDDKSSAAPSATSGVMPTASSDILEAQRKRFEELKNQARSPSSTTDGASKSKEDSLFDAMASSAAAKSSPAPDRKRSALEDLAELKVFSSPSSAAAASSAAVSNNPFQSDSFASPGSAWSQPGPSGYQEVDLFSEIRGKPQPDFDSVFGGSGVPSSSSSSSSAAAALRGSPSRPLMGGGGGHLLTPEAVGAHASLQHTLSPQAAGLTKDVDSSLVQAAENLTLGFSDKTGMIKKTEHQWKPTAPSVKTGGESFMKMQILPKTLQPHQPPPAQPQGGGQPANWSGAMHAGHFPVQLTQQPVGVMWQQPQPVMGQPRPQQDLFGNVQPSLF